MSSHAPNPSIYQPLDNPSQEIRLLQIESPPKSSPKETTPVAVVAFLSALLCPPRRRTQAPAKFKLLTFKLNEAPPYKALSYTWGNPNLAGTILVDGQDIPTGHNLSTALQRLYQDDTIEYIWADALCINQSDDEEKSHQVPLMSQIYSRAEIVFIWLGEELSSTEKAFTFMRTSLLYAEELIDIGSLISDSNRQAMEQIFKNPYWTRVWVLQEFSYASKCHLICGRHTFDMANVQYFLFFWDTVDRLQLDFPGSSDWRDDVFGPLREFIDVRAGTSLGQAYMVEFQRQTGWHEILGDRSQQTSPAHSDIFTLFARTQRYNATDIRDKFYALLNLIPSEHRIVEPNYRLSEAELYRDLITRGITHYNSLYCITMGGVGTFQDPACSDLPSWIPDFRKIGNPEFPYSYPVFMKGIGNQNKLDASCSKGPLYSVSGKHLTAMGFSVDKIRDMTWILFSNENLILHSIALFLGAHDWKQDGQTDIYKDLFSAIFPPQLLIEPYDPFLRVLT
ncbi:hypothetical protein CEP52_004213 [Fusarium oligoseptatum]|uniref:Heterokaryon incompatibility domain-containing protein n=1 Tax=Fusarium oligoseptatum TaxID=2604345 RepID=A0A428U4R5_9HYPO|nr:hypothetical protein CEP52_004213 [Fusarium oligoseptatum]